MNDGIVCTYKIEAILIKIKNFQAKLEWIYSLETESLVLSSKESVTENA